VDAVPTGSAGDFAVSEPRVPAGHEPARGTGNGERKRRSNRVPTV